MADRRTRTDHGRARREVYDELARPREDDKAAAHRELIDLAVCPCCGKSLVQPLDWEPVSTSDWSVVLRCPECEWRGKGTYDQDMVDRFDDALDEGIKAILDDLELLSRANREEEIDRFAAALEADLILPEDF